MKKLLYLFAAIGFLAPLVSFAAPTTTILLRPQIPSLASVGNPCLTVGNAASLGLISTSTCGGGGGSASGTIGDVQFSDGSGGLTASDKFFFDGSSLNLGFSGNLIINGDAATLTGPSNSGISLSSGAGLGITNSAFAKTALIDVAAISTDTDFSLPDTSGAARTFTLGTGFTPGDCITGLDAFTVNDAGFPCLVGVGTTTDITFWSSPTNVTADDNFSWDSANVTLLLTDFNGATTTYSPSFITANQDFLINGAGVVAGNGQNINVIAGNTSDGSSGCGGPCTGGNLQMGAGSGAVGNSGGGETVLFSGGAVGDADGGAFLLQSGFADQNGNGGDISVLAGNGGAVSGNGGNILFQAGTVASGANGTVSLKDGRANEFDVNANLDHPFTFFSSNSAHSVALGLDNLTSDRQVDFPDAAGTFTLGTGFTPGDCISALDANTVQDAGSPCGTGGSSLTSTYVGFGSAGNTVTGNGNLTFTSSTHALNFPLANASGSQSYSLSNDTSGFLEINASGTIPGSGGSSTQPWNILLQNVNYDTSTLHQAEDTISQAINFPDGSRVFYDHSLEAYPPFYGWGDFLTANGTSSSLYPYFIEFTDKSGNHAQPFSVGPVNSSTNSSGYNFAINNLGGETDMTGFLFQSGDLLQSGGAATFSGTSFTASTTALFKSTLTANVTSTFKGNISTTLSNTLVYANAQGILVATSGPSTGSAPTGTAFNFPYFLSGGTGLAPTSTISENTSNTFLSLFQTNSTAGSSSPLSVYNTPSATSIPTINIAPDGAVGSTSDICFDALRFCAGYNGSIGVLQGGGGKDFGFYTNASTLGGGTQVMLVGGGNTYVLGGVELPPAVPQSATSPQLLLGSKLLNAGNASGTALGSNQLNTFNGDFINLQINSSTKFKIASSGLITTSLTANSFVATDGSGNLVVTSTPSSAFGNVFMNSTSTSLANNVPFLVTTGSSTISSTSTLSLFSTGANVTGTLTVTATTTIGTATTTFIIFQNGHIDATGTPAQVSSCGTSPSITGTDVAGSVQVGSVSATGCTITFASAYVATPTCTVTERTGSVANAFSYAVTTTTIVVTQTALTSDILDYRCNALE